MSETLINIAKNLKESGLSYRKIAEAVHASKSTVYRWLSGILPKTTIKKENRKQQVLGCLENNPDFVIRDIASYCNISVGTAYNTLKELNYSKKKFTKSAPQTSMKWSKKETNSQQSSRTFPLTK